MWGTAIVWTRNLFVHTYLFFEKHPKSGTLLTVGGFALTLLEYIKLTGQAIAAVGAAFMAIVTVYSWIKKNWRNENIRKL